MFTSFEKYLFNQYLFCIFVKHEHKQRISWLLFLRLLFWKDAGMSWVEQMK